MTDSISFEKVDHIGIAVNNLKQAIEKFSSMLGFPPLSIEEVPEQNVKAAFFRIGETNLELLESTKEDSLVSKFLSKRGNGVHHVCLKVNNIEKLLEELKSKDMKLIDEKARIGAHKKKVAFIHPNSTNGVLIELSESIED